MIWMLIWAFLSGQELKLVETMRFGGGDDDRYLWQGANQPCTFTVNQKGHVFVIDARNVRILEFDDKGAFVRQLASQGQGPGEYQSVAQFQILTDGSAIGLDGLQGTLRRQIYDKELNFQHAEVLSGLTGFAPKILFSPTGSYAYAWFLKFNADTSTLTSLSAITDSNLQPLEIFHETPWPTINGATLSDRALLVQALASQFNGVWQLNAKIARHLTDDRLMYVDNINHKIEIRTADAKTTLVEIKHTLKPEAFEDDQRQALVSSLEEHLFNQGGQALMQIVTPAVLRESIEQADLPRVNYSVHDVVPVNDGGFFLLTDVDYQRKSITLQRFDKSGTFMGRAPYPGDGVWTVFGTRIAATDKAIYGMEVNEDGDHIVVRYAY
ncbi:MAG: 6-bladed beta-propeller [Acidobacteria bacterium]|nr:6-bladed beta-propeller [Acidobacteriota bacterium]